MCITIGLATIEQQQQPGGYLEWVMVYLYNYGFFSSHQNGLTRVERKGTVVVDSLHL